MVTTGLRDPMKCCVNVPAETSFRKNYFVNTDPQTRAEQSPKNRNRNIDLNDGYRHDMHRWKFMWSVSNYYILFSTGKHLN